MSASRAAVFHALIEVLLVVVLLVVTNFACRVLEKLATVCGVRVQDKRGQFKEPTKSVNCS